MAGSPRVGSETDTPVNDVHLVGRVADEPVSRELPSGDVVTTLRLVVRRAPVKGRSAASVDTIDCALWTARLRRQAEGLSKGCVVEVAGSLRRRFWRAGSGAASRYEVEVRSLRRVRTPVLARAD